MGLIPTQVSDAVSNVNVGGPNILLIIALILLGVIFVSLLIAVIAFLIIYKYKIVVRKEGGGTYIKRAKKIRIGNVYKLKIYKLNRVLNPGDMIGKGRYYYFEDRVGMLMPYFWTDLKTVLDKDPSYANLSLINMENEYTREALRSFSQNKGFWEKYGTFIAILTILIIGLIGTYLSAQANAQAASEYSGAMKQLPGISANLNNVSQYNYQTTILLYKVYQNMQNQSGKGVYSLYPSNGTS